MLNTVAPGNADALPTALVGVTPFRYLLTLAGRADIGVGHPDVRTIALRHGVNPDDPTVVRLVSDADRLARLGAGVP